MHHLLQLLLAAVLVSYELLPMLSDMGLWCVVMMGAVQVLAWGMFVVSLNAGASSGKIIVII